MSTVETAVLPEQLLSFAREADSLRAELFTEPDGQFTFYIWMTSPERSGFISGRFGRPGNWFQFYVTDGTESTRCWITGGPMECETFNRLEESE